jgi:hypothetical protein
VHNFPTLNGLVPLDRDVLGPLDDAFHRNSFDGRFRNDLGSVLPQVLNGILINLSDISRGCLHIPPLLIFSDSPLVKNPLSPLTDLVVSDPLLEGNIINSTLA